MDELPLLEAVEYFSQGIEEARPTLPILLASYGYFVRALKYASGL